MRFELRNGAIARARKLEGEMDEQGRLVIPAEFAANLGLAPGARVPLVEEKNSLRLYRPLSHLAKVYVEPTNHCNLACRTCMRHSWDEPAGEMEWETFAAIIATLEALSPVPKVFFGGFGEPLSHPQILDMVRQAKKAGGAVEMITNATLLGEETASGLVEAGLDTLWVSLDGATPESYGDVRLGAMLPEVLANLRRFREDCRLAEGGPALGIAFVAMRRNLGDLPALLDLGVELGASHFMVSNVIPHTVGMCEEVLYRRSLGDAFFTAWRPRLDLPLLDADETTREALYQALRREVSLSVAGRDISDSGNHCPFVESGSVTVSWSGDVSPCLPLAHTHTAYLNRRRRLWKRYVVGNVRERSLREIWEDANYAAFRERVGRFDFPPCVSCGTCHLAESNDDDCFGSPFPSCGGCPWARGIAQCP